MFFDNLKAICDEKNLKVTPLVLECGGTKGILGGWKKGASPNSDIVVKLADRLNVSIEMLLRTPESARKAMEKLNQTLLTPDKQELNEYYDQLSDMGKGKVIGTAKTLLEMEQQQNKTVSGSADDESDSEDDYFLLPFYDCPVSAGTGIDIDYDIYETIKVKSIYDDADFAVKVSGDSMEPRFSDGDIVLVKSMPIINVGEIGIFILNGQSFIKERGENALISLNENYPNIPIGEGDRAYCQGKVIGILDVKKGA